MTDTDPLPPAAGPPPGTFAYEAQSAEGRTFSGTLDAAAITAAAEQLKALHLRVTRLEPVARPARTALGDDAFLAVNRQLAHLTAGGLPLERGLRLIADELPRRQARAVRAIAADLEAGVPLGDAFAGREAGPFPPLYGRVLEAGAGANALPAVLANLGRHVEMLQRLRAAVWRSASYPLMVAVALLVVMAFIWGYVMPQFAPLTRGLSFDRQAYFYKSPSPPPPNLAPWIALARWGSYALMVVLAGLLAATAGVVVVSRSPAGRRWLEPRLLTLPVVGPVVRWNQVARWCDALQLAVGAGLDLPAALALAGQSVDSAAVREDTDQLAGAVAAGRNLEGTGRLRLLPPMVPAALALGVEQNDLPAAAATLARMYQEQAEVRLAVLPQVLSPALLVLVAASVTLALGAALLPLVALLRSFSG